MALAVVFVVSLGAVAAREAQAQQPPQAQQHTEVIQYTVVIDGGVIEPEAGTPSVETPTVNSTPPVGQRVSGGAGSEPTSVPDPMSEPVLQSGSASGLPVSSSPAPDPAPAEDLGSESVPAADPETTAPVDLVPEPISFEENDPLLLQIDESSVSDSETEEAPILSSLYTTMGSAEKEPLESIANVLQNFSDGSPFLSGAEDEDSIGTVLADLFYGREADHALIDEGTEYPSPTETESPSKDTPQPPPPSTPVGSSSFSLSGGGQVGPGGVAPLLLCILASSLILLRRDGKLSRVFCELPKPSSALLLPLERPG